MKLDHFFQTAISVDNVIFGYDEGDLKVLLIQRGAEPFKGLWALPGDLVYPDEDLNKAAVRVLKELTGLQDVYLEQVYSFGAVDRHPLGRVVTVAYYSLIKIKDYNLNASSFAKQAKWHSVSKIKQLAFDHNKILNACVRRLRQRVKAKPVGFNLLPQKFTLTELQHLYEAVFETNLDKRNFRKKILSLKLIIDINEMQEGVAHRPAKLYQLNEKKYKELLEDGYSFVIGSSEKNSNGR